MNGSTEMITSRSNPRIKQVRALRQRKHRKAGASFLVEGIHHVGEAVEADMASVGRVIIEAIYYSPELLRSAFANNLIREQTARGVSCFATSAQVFESLAGKENPQGILAEVRKSEPPLEELNAANFSWGVALAGPQDPGNVGGILRSIDAAGASGLILLDNSVDPYHPTCVRASMGALFWHPVASASFVEFVGWARRHEFRLYGTSARAGDDYLSLPSSGEATILLMGSEQAGLSPEQSAACDQLVRIPMYGRVTSLNLAVATGILLYAMKWRDQDGSEG